MRKESIACKGGLSQSGFAAAQCGKALPFRKLLVINRGYASIVEA
jgi:hypothetical protein